MELIRTPKEHEIAKEFFLEATTTTAVSNEIFPKAKYKNVGMVSGNLSKWRKAGYIKNEPIFTEVTNKKTGKKSPRKIIGSRLNLNPYFEYAQKKLSMPIEEKIEIVELLNKMGLTNNKELDSTHDKDIVIERKELEKELKDTEFNDVEKEILNYIFSFRETREIACKSKDLFEGITNVLERIFFYQSWADSDESIKTYFMKGFFIKNKEKYIKREKRAWREFKKRIKGDKEARRRFEKRDREKDCIDKIREFQITSTSYFNKLKQKIQIISNFGDVDYWNLIVKTELRKYQYMDSLRKINSIKDKGKKWESIAIWEKLYHTDSIPEGW